MQLELSAGVFLEEPRTPLLGKGFFGAVKKYRHLDTGKIIAIKEVHEDVVSQFGLEDQLKKEVELQRRIESPYVVKLYFHEVASRINYIGMEYASNGTLFDRIRKNGPLRLPVAMYILRSLLIAVSECHRNDIIHRDIKPENVVFGYDDTPKLTDFGWASFSSTISSESSPRNTFCGTLQYLSPEVILGETQNTKVDSWSLGLIFYEMLTGIAPFASTSRAEIIQDILNVKLHFPDFLFEEIKEFILKLLNPNPSCRLSIAGALADPFINSSRIPNWVIHETKKNSHEIRSPIEREASTENDKLLLRSCRMIGLPKLLNFCANPEETAYCLAQVHEFVSHLLFIATLRSNNEAENEITNKGLQIPEIPVTTKAWEEPPKVTKKKSRFSGFFGK